MFSLFLACASPAEAPAGLDDLSHWLYVEQESEDPAGLTEGFDNLVTWSADVDFAADWEDRAYSIAPLSREDIDHLVVHDRDPQATFGVGVAHFSAHDIDTHAGVIVMEDQTPVEPSAGDYYVRTFIDGTAECFLDRTCEAASTVNDVHRDNILYEMEYLLYKDVRWVQTDGGWGVAARSWLEDEETDSDLVPLYQSYSLDLYVPLDGGTFRWHVSWQETEVPGIDVDGMSAILGMGIEDMFGAWDDYMGEL